ncbi:hypothetical protein ACIBHX_16970 [Nonomuraea sp. NPDC050536]|uniref:hypothetical protein n=1 Tax=Nonomuraea sp. NPDC050536 TaxID=3364366 RepID=UPI0037CC0411
MKPRSSAQIRGYLIDQLNLALTRPSMFGGELSLRILVDHLAYATGEDLLWEEELRLMVERGACCATMVKGAFRALFEGIDEHAPASVYAEFARNRRWLSVDRTLRIAEYESLRQGLGTWTVEDRTLGDVVEAFGTPSLWIGGTNPSFGKTLGYASERVGDPMVFFHLWNDFEYDQPILLAVRCGTGPFRETFTFTPEGRKRRNTAGAAS